MGNQIAVGQSQALLIMPGFRQGDGFLQEGQAQVEPQIDGLRAPVRAVGEESMEMLGVRPRLGSPQPSCPGPDTNV